MRPTIHSLNLKLKKQQQEHKAKPQHNLTKIESVKAYI